MDNGKIYAAIDLKSFYASVECIERGLDPLATNLVVADASRTDKTICLAVSPSLKSFGIPGRPRLFEVIQKLKVINSGRLQKAPNRFFSGESFLTKELSENASLSVGYIVAAPRMALYMKYSAEVYKTYLKHISPDDIHVYSIDEVFIDLTAYIQTYKKTPHEITMMLIHDVLETTGITATAGIGTNLYLAKIAMDIVAKHIAPDENGVRIAELDELTYRKQLWGHTPITDFWRVGKGYAKKLEAYGLYTMGDIARCSIGKPSDWRNEELLYTVFGVNAELLIDHAWGWEPCTITDIKNYKPSSKSIDSGQVLQCPYTAAKARIVVREMADLLSFDLLEKQLVTSQVVVTVGYDISCLTDPKISKLYNGPTTSDAYGRKVPKAAHGSQNLNAYSSSSKKITQAVLSLYDRITDSNLLIRRLNVSVSKVLPESEAANIKARETEQLDFLTDYNARALVEKAESEALSLEKKRQLAMLSIKKKFGKNAIVRGTDLQEGATLIERNKQIGGHKA